MEIKILTSPFYNFSLYFSTVLIHQKSRSLKFMYQLRMKIKLVCYLMGFTFIQTRNTQVGWGILDCVSCGTLYGCQSWTRPSQLSKPNDSRLSSHADEVWHTPVVSSWFRKQHRSWACPWGQSSRRREQSQLSATDIHKAAANTASCREAKHKFK